MLTLYGLPINCWWNSAPFLCEEHLSSPNIDWIRAYLILLRIPWGKKIKSVKYIFKRSKVINCIKSSRSSPKPICCMVYIYVWFEIFDRFYLLFPHWFLYTIKYALIQSIFGLENCSLHKNGAEFDQKLIGNIFRGLAQQKCVHRADKTKAF